MSNIEHRIWMKYNTELDFVPQSDPSLRAKRSNPPSKFSGSSADMGIASLLHSSQGLMLVFQALWVPTPSMVV
jgi:hypothetical protein